MAKYTTLKALFTAIADAIRGKEGSTDMIVADDFPERVQNLATYEGEDALISTTPLTYTNDRVTEIEMYAFSDRSIREFTFANVTEIDRYAFGNCEYLGKITCPKVQYIGAGAFMFAGVMRSSFEIVCRKCGYVGSRAFESANITRFYMYPSNYIEGELYFEISGDAFGYSRIEHLIIASENGEMCQLDTGDGMVTFEETPIANGTGYIYVPRALIEDYKVAENWSTYASQFRALEDYTVDGTVTGELDESKI